MCGVVFLCGVVRFGVGDGGREIVGGFVEPTAATLATTVGCGASSLALSSSATTAGGVGDLGSAMSVGFWGVGFLVGLGFGLGKSDDLSAGSSVSSTVPISFFPSASTCFAFSSSSFLFFFSASALSSDRILPSSSIAATGLGFFGGPELIEPLPKEFWKVRLSDEVKSVQHYLISQLSKKTQNEFN